MSAPSVHRIAATTPLIEAPAERNEMMTFEFAKFINTHSTDYIRMADQKAAILITLLSANLLVLVQKAGQYLSDGHSPGLLFLVVMACIYCTVSLGVAVNVIRPRIFKNAKHGHVFWEDIAAQDKHAYARGIQDLTVNGMLYELGEHNHNLAKSAMRKYRWLRAGFFMALISVASSATLILLTSGV